MYIILLLISIPILCVSLALYFLTLVTFTTTSELNSTILIISMLVNVIFTFVVPNLLLKNFDDSAFLLNRKQSFTIIHSYISYIFIFLFGLALIINSLILEFNIIRLIVGIIIVSLFIYINILYYINTKDRVLKLGAILEVKRGVSCLIFIEDNYEYEFYTRDADKYRIDNCYKCTYNYNLKRILKVSNEVIDRG